MKTNKYQLTVDLMDDKSVRVMVGLAQNQWNEAEGFAQAVIQLMVLVAMTSDLGFNETLTKLVEDAKRINVQHIGEQAYES